MLGPMLACVSWCTIAFAKRRLLRTRPTRALAAPGQPGCGHSGWRAHSRGAAWYHASMTLFDRLAFGPRPSDRGTVLRPEPAHGQRHSRVSTLGNQHRHSRDPEVHGSEEIPIGEIECLPVRTAKGEV